MLPVQDNPTTAVTFHFQDGASLSWRLGKPWPQTDLFLEVGNLAAKYGLGITFELPEQTEAAAPEMLAALEGFVQRVNALKSQLRRPVWLAACMREAEAAIAKAKGGEPNGETV